MSEPWTIDGIAHALPHPELRATFMREVNFTPVDRLPAALEKWRRLVEDFDAQRPRAEALGSYYREHGQLPPDYEATLIDMTDALQADAGQHRRGAA